MGEHKAMFEKLCSKHLLFEAWKIVKAKKSAGGVDGVTLDEFEKNIDQHISELSVELKNKKWSPEPYLMIEIPKKENEKRKLGLLSIKDKIVQLAIRTLVEPIFESIFIENSYGYRPNKGHTRAVKRTYHECRLKKNIWALRLDVDNYFDTIDHQKLANRLHAIINDDEIVRLMMLSMEMGNVNKRLKWRDCEEGVPQGAILSPLLSNFYLHEFDKYVQTFNRSYIRYADDFVLMCATRDEANAMYAKLSKFLKEKLCLTLNEPQIVELSQGFEFLGIFISKNGMNITTQKETSLKERIDQLSLTANGFTTKYAKKWAGIKNYYAPLLPQNILQRLDKYLRERLQQLIAEFHNNIPNKSRLQKWLEAVDFLSTENQLHKRRIINELITAFTQHRSSAKSQITKEQNKHIIDKKKTEYRKRESENSELMITSFGCYLGINEKGVSIKQKGKIIASKPLTSLRHITICTRGVSISSNLIEYCMEHGIAIDFFTSSGAHTASILSGKFMQGTLWRKQAQCSLENRNWLATAIISAKIKNQFNLVKYYHKYHKTSSNPLEKYYDDLEAFNKKLKMFTKSPANSDDYMTQLVGFEAQGAVKYWAYIQAMLTDDNVGFDHREQRGAKDLVNNMLNYGYALLYNRAWQALLGAKLNPYDSIIHARQPGKPTFVYDFVEIFRSQVVDRVVISLIQKGMALGTKDNWLDDETKKLLAKSILERLNRYEKYQGEEITLLQIIQRQASAISAWFDSGQKYKPYIAKW